MISIESKDNNLFKETKKLKERKGRNKKSKYIIEGYRLVEEAFKAKVSIDYVFVDDDGEIKIQDYIKKYNLENMKIYKLANNLVKELASTENPQGIIAVANMKPLDISLEGSFYLLCDKVQDPGNLGTIIRSCHAAGVDGIILTKGTVDVYNEKTLRSTMGSIFYIGITYDDEELSIIKKLKSKGFSLVSTSLQESNNLYDEDLSEKVIVCVGNEGNGVSDQVFEMSDKKVKIPMPGSAESLNVAIATSIILFEKVRQNQLKK